MVWNEIWSNIVMQLSVLGDEDSTIIHMAVYRFFFHGKKISKVQREKKNFFRFGFGAKSWTNNWIFDNDI